jgi:hypothetical protein
VTLAIFLTGGILAACIAVHDTTAYSATAAQLSQASTKAATNAASPDSYVLRKQRLQADIEQTQQTLVAQLKSYQQREKKYQIAHSQYQTHDSLQALSDAVTAARQAMQARNQVLMTYLKLLRLKLIDSEGIDLQQKNHALNQIETNLFQLEQYQQKLAGVTDRLQLNQLAAEFKPQDTVEAEGGLLPQVKSTAYLALDLLAIGKLQAVYDQALIISQRAKQHEATESASLNQKRREQYLTEIERDLNLAQSELRQLWSELRAIEPDSHSRSYQSFYRGMFADLNSVYSQLSQLVAHIEEVMGVETTTDN